MHRYHKKQAADGVQYVLLVNHVHEDEQGTVTNMLIDLLSAYVCSEKHRFTAEFRRFTLQDEGRCRNLLNCESQPHFVCSSCNRQFQ
jgi:hypothetical protein